MLLLLYQSQHCILIFDIRCTMILSRGSNGLCPCPKCLIPKDRQAEGEGLYPHRDAEYAKSIVRSVSMTETIRDDLLKQHGLRNVDVSIE